MRKDPHRLPPLDLLGAFEVAARHLSFTKAGHELFVTQSAVSRQIKALEDDLGAPLFRRRHRAVELTDEGRRLADAVRSALGGLRVTVGEIRAPHRRQVLSLTTTPGLASLWLIPRLSSFVAAHPGIDVRIDATFGRRDLAGEGFDLAIRYGRIGATEGTALFAEATQPACAPALARDPARPLRVPADLRHHTLLQTAMPAGASIPLEWEPWLRAVGLERFEPAGTMTFTNYDEAVAAALAGQGVVLGRRPLIDGLLRRRALVAPFKGETASARGYFLVLAPDVLHKPAVRELQQWLLEQAEQGRGGNRESAAASRRRVAGG